MKTMKKMMALVIAVVMCMSMSLVAFAAEGDVSLIVNNPVGGHTYKYFQLFTGDLSGSDDSKLSNVKWGSNVASSITYKEKANAETTTFTVDKTILPTVGGVVPQAVLDYVASLASNELSTANTLSAWVTGSGTAITAETKVAPGYYVIKDEYTDATADQTSTLSTNIVAVIDDVTISPKAGTTEHKKEVVDVNDTNDTKLDLSNLKGLNGWSESADYDIGDDVAFKLTTKIASDFAKYTSYVLKVHDTLGDGLTLNESSIKVYIGNTEATKGSADGNYAVTKDGQSFSIDFAKLNANAAAAAGVEVTVYYTAKLTGANVVIGNPGNPNTSYAEYSNNPNGNQSGTAKTPEDTVVVFTYKTDVDKIKSDGTALAGAGFTLYKKVNSDTAIPEGKTNVAGTTPAGAKDTTFPSGEFWYAVGTVAAGTTTNFEFKGIDDGTYVLVESTTPAGYNTIDPITLTVTATHAADSNSTTGYSVSAINVSDTNFKADAKGGEITFTKKNATKKPLASGEIYSEIVNQSGSSLPSTGGIGTTIFYVVGTILVLAAVVLLITKKRMHADK